jgi:lactate permease
MTIHLSEKFISSWFIQSRIVPFEGSPGNTTSWMQAYDPTHHWWLSTIWAALPLVVLLAAMIGLRLKGHISALLALGVALVIAVGIFHMPMHLAALSTVLGAGYGLFPIFWIVFPVIFMYQLTVRAGRFGLLQECLVGVTEDSRLQLLLIAFIFGAFFEGAVGFGTPVAVCGTILLGLGFLPLEAAGLALLANTAPVAFDAVGTPVIALHGVTGLDALVLTSVVATLLTPFLYPGALLAHLGVCGIQSHVRSLAGDSRLRHGLRSRATSTGQTSWSMAG